jgi:ABC-type transport system involved in multi-copper enzyme maturation permease subunit
MIWLPILSRELMSEARHPMSYGLRWGCVLLMVGVLGAAIADKGAMVVGKGNELFGVLQPTLFTLISIVVPVLTCDAISRERREGTLGLLLMTPLRPRDVALAKTLSSMLRALTMVLATLPVLVIPILAGGLSGVDLLRGLLMDGMALVTAMAAGLFASSRCREFHRAAALSILVALAILLMLGGLQPLYLVILGSVGLTPGNLGSPFEPEILFMIFTAGSWLLCSGFSDIWQQARTSTTPPVLWLCLAQLLLALCFLRWVVGAMDRSLPKCLAELGPTARQERWWRRLFTPVLFREALRVSSRSRMERNPSGWLQRRGWEAQLVSRGGAIGLLALELFLVLFVLYSDWISSRDFLECQPFLALLFVMLVSFSAVNGFRRELETGALELLVVTPLSVGEIVRGRVCGLWGQYVPGVLVWLTSVAMICMVDIPADRLGSELVEFLILVVPVFVGAFLALPIIGLSQSLQLSNFMLRWLFTLGLGLILPLVTPMAVVWSAELLSRGSGTFFGLWSDETMLFWITLTALILQGLFAWISARSLVRRLTTRSFAMGG